VSSLSLLTHKSWKHVIDKEGIVDDGESSSSLNPFTLLSLFLSLSLLEFESISLGKKTFLKLKQSVFSFSSFYKLLGHLLSDPVAVNKQDNILGSIL